MATIIALVKAQLPKLRRTKEVRKPERSDYGQSFIGEAIYMIDLEEWNDQQQRLQVLSTTKSTKSVPPMPN